jgi:hypothetical protein
MKGEIEKLKVKPLTLDDNFTRDGLEAISTLTGKEPYYIVGGVATQSYLPTTCRRPTSDIDLLMVRPLNYEGFKILSRPVAEYLLDNGYSVETKKGSRAFSLDVRNRDGEGLLIEMSGRNEQSFERSRRRLERELAHSKRKIVEDRKSTYSVASPEDIVVPKLTRSVNNLVKYPEFMYNLQDPAEIFTPEFIVERLKIIKNLREKAMDSLHSLLLFDRLKFVSDIFDIRVLSEMAGINIEYFNDSRRDWDTLSQNIPEVDILFSLTLPRLSH